jgi:hypothetical protein
MLSWYLNNDEDGETSRREQRLHAAANLATAISQAGFPLPHLDHALRLRRAQAPERGSAAFASESSA